MRRRKIPKYAKYWVICSYVIQKKRHGKYALLYHWDKEVRKSMPKRINSKEYLRLWFLSDVVVESRDFKRACQLADCI